MCNVRNVKCNVQTGFWQYRGYRPRYEYLVDAFDLDNRAWITEDQLRISLSPILVSKLKGN
jgi:hypothetical protein